MAFIIGKKQDGKTYYYLAESARVDGKPRIVSQRYLGSAEEVMVRLGEVAPGEPYASRHLSFGDLGATWSVIVRLHIAEIIDEVVGPRRSDAQASVGTYIALMILNRVVSPCSKLGFSQWWSKTAGDHLVHLPPAALDHRRFWEAMDAVTDTQLIEIERRIVSEMVRSFGLDCSGLVLDMTNFATYIDSGNEKAQIAQRGHAKQKRTDLRLVGLGLVVSTDGGIPLVSHTYAGNRPDVTQFPLMVNELAARFQSLAGTDADAELTLVYDAGQDSEANQTKVALSGLHFVGSLPPSDHPELLSIKRSRYQVVDEDVFGGLTYFETTKNVLGAKYRLVVTHSENLHQKQVRGFSQTLGKAIGQLNEVQARLERGKTRKDRSALEDEVRKILSPRWCKRVITWNLTGDSAGEFRLAFAIDEIALKALEDEQFGKRILFTDRNDWPVARVVSAYRSQSQVEADFRQMKDPSVVSFSPMFHWTDQKIRVHVFYCVLALAVARLMVREAKQAGLSISVPELLDTLAGIQETVLLYKGERGRPRARRMLSEIDPTQRKLYDLFGLDAYAPKR
jgi:transposase